jgi:hypothetical protein
MNPMTLALSTHPPGLGPRAHLLAASALAALAATTPAPAQLPTGHLAVAAFASGSQPGAILHFDPATQQLTPVGGAIPQYVNSIAVDAATGDYYVGGTGSGTSPAPGQILRLSLYGSTVTASTLHAQLPSPYYTVPALTMDERGDLIVAANSSTNGQVFRVARNSGVVTPLTPSPLPLRINAMTGKDVIYVGLIGASSQPSEIWRIDANGTTTPVATTAGVVSGNQWLTGLALGPDSDELWASGFGNPSLFKVYLDYVPGTSPTVTPVPLVSSPLNDVRYDDGTQRFYFCSTQASPNQVWSVDRYGNYWTLQTAMAVSNVGVLSQMAFAPQPGELSLLPCSVSASVSQAVPLETTLHGLPGELGLIYLSGVQFTGFGFFPLATPLVISAFNNGQLRLPPLPFPVDPSWMDTAIYLGEARLDQYGNVLEHEPLAATFAMQDKIDWPEKLDADPGTLRPWKHSFGPYVFPNTLKVNNTGPATVYLMERDLGPPAGPWHLVAVIHGGDPSVFVGPGWAQLKEYRVEIVGGPAAKTTVNWN